MLPQYSVFLDGFDLDAADAVLEIPGEPKAPLLIDMLQALRDKSLLRTHVLAEDGDARRGLYETVREYAAARLRASGGLEATVLRRTHHLVSWSEQWAERAAGSERSRWVPPEARC